MSDNCKMTIVIEYLLYFIKKDIFFMENIGGKKEIFC